MGFEREAILDNGLSERNLLPGRNIKRLARTELTLLLADNVGYANV